MLQVTLYKYLAIGAVLIALVGGSYAFGHSSGYDSGFNTAKNEQQVVINNLTSQINAEHNATNTKINELETKAATLQSKVDHFVAVQAVVVTKLVTQYKTEHVVDAASCGLSESIVPVINELIVESNKDPFMDSLNTQTTDKEVTK